MPTTTKELRVTIQPEHTSERSEALVVKPISKSGILGIEITQGEMQVFIPTDSLVTLIFALAEVGDINDLDTLVSPLG